jgi:hypothetical protein
LSGVEFSKDGCKGYQCPVWTLAIDSARNAVFNAIRNNRTNGIFKTQLTERRYLHLITLIEKIKVDMLKDRYRSRISESPLYKLTFYYDDGSKVETTTEGFEGPNEIRKVYKALIAILKKQSWK